MTKATTAEGDQLKRGVNWATSRRGILKVFEDRLECGDWRIDYPDISQAVLYSIRSLLFFHGYVLKVSTPNKTYHFGLNWGRFWKSDLPFEVSREKGSLGHTALSVLVRILVVGFIAYWIWLKLKQ